MKTVMGTVVLSALLALSAGCSSSPGTTAGDGGGVDSSRKLSSLGDADVGVFCDQLAAIEGGYSKEKSLTCSDDAGATITVTETFQIGANQAACKTQFRTQLPATCANITVGEVTSCVTDIYGATCADTGGQPSSCDTFFACAT